MTPSLSANTQAILLLTAPLNVGPSSESAPLLTPSEYKSLAIHLRNLQKEPADLIQSEASDVLDACRPIINVDRLRKLLARGFQLSQALERWQSRAIWVLSRADAQYPRRMKSRLREDAPAVLYGCGNMDILDSGGLAVVGSRDVNDELIEYAADIGRLAAHAGRTVVSGGARGVDKAAMKGALEAGGHVIGVLAENLEKIVMNRDERNPLRDGRLVLVSAYDPSAGFNVGHALQRNKLIYAFSEACLVVNSDINKGGTWAGAVEQLERLRYVPVYVRSVGRKSAGLDALQKKGAIPWPNPTSVGELEYVFQIKLEVPQRDPQPNLPMFADEGPPSETPLQEDMESRSTLFSEASPEPLRALSISEAYTETPNSEHQEFGATREQGQTLPHEKKEDSDPTKPRTPAEVLFATVRQVILQLVQAPMKDTEIAVALNVSNAQAKIWLQQLVDDGIVEKKMKPVAYVAKST
ncbi:DNA-processing protein DprA [Cupriavidus necator]